MHTIDPCLHLLIDQLLFHQLLIKNKLIFNHQQIFLNKKHTVKEKCRHRTNQVQLYTYYKLNEN
jgi:hypothetical protein